MLFITLVIIFCLEISVGLCGECQIKRTAKNNGMHRDIVTEIVLIQVSSSPLSCKVLLIEFVPSGLYVDTHQVKSIGQPQIYSASKINTEKPEYLSHSYELYMWQDFTMNTSQSTTVTVTLPVHIRYHRPSAESSANVILEPPRIFAQCEGSDFVFQRIEGTSAFSPCGANNISSMCEWRELHCSSQPDSHRLEFIMPVGNPDHMMPVLVITLMFTIGGTVALIYFTCTANNTLPPRQPRIQQESPTRQVNSNNSRGASGKQHQHQNSNHSSSMNSNNSSSSHHMKNRQNSSSNLTTGGESHIQKSNSNSNQNTGGANGNSSEKTATSKTGGGVHNNENGGSGVEVNHSMKNGGKEVYNLRRRGTNDGKGK